ncbi:MAG: histidine phosphatase family protein [Acidobacteriota bacterium]
MKLYLIRHGETDWNKSNLVQGWSESDLNANGQWQAEMLAKRFQQSGERLTAVYTSPLRRALQTAMPTAEMAGIRPVEDPDLREMRCGAWEGLNFDELKVIHPEAFQAWADSAENRILGGGESIRDLLERAVGSLGRIVGAHEDGDSVAVFTHGGVIRVLLAHLLGVDLQIARRCNQDNASINFFHRRLGIFLLVRWNDISHLICGGNGRQPSRS